MPSPRRMPPMKIPIDNNPWDVAYMSLWSWTNRHGHPDPPPGESTSRDLDLHAWVRIQHRAHELGRLPADHAERLAALPGWSWRPAPVPGDNVPHAASAPPPQNRDPQRSDGHLRSDPRSS